MVAPMFAHVYMHPVCLCREKGLICGARELKDIVKNVGRDPT